MKKEDFSIDQTQEKYLLETLPLIRRIAARRLRRRHPEAIDDITQRVILKLWRWNIRRQTKSEADEKKTAVTGKEAKNGTNIGNGSNRSNDFTDCAEESEGECLPALSISEWRRLAGRATENEIKTFYVEKHQKEIHLTAEPTGEDDNWLAGRLQAARVEGSTAYELRSQLCGIWKSFRNLTLRERYAFALKKRMLCNQLVGRGCCRVDEIAAALEISREKFIGIYKSLPLDETQIARLLEKKLGKKVSPSLVTKARARAKIRRALSTGNSNGQSSDKEKT